jgi:methyl-accepting chemotaxis protein
MLIGVINIPFALFLGIIGIIGVVQVNQLLLSVQQRDLGAIYHLSQAKADILQARVMGRQALLEENLTAIQSNIEGSKANRELALEEWHTYLSLPELATQTDVAAITKTFDVDWQRFVEAYDQLYTLASEHSLENQRQGVALTHQNNGGNLVAFLDQLISNYQAAAETSKLAGSTTFSIVLFFIIGASLLAMLLTFLAVQRFAKTITGPITKLHEVALAISAGNLSSQVELNSRDELGQLAAVFNQMTLSLDSAQKNRVTVSTTIHKLTSDLRHIAYQQAGGSQEQATSVNQISQSVRELSQTASHIFTLATQVSTEVAQAAQASLSIKQSTDQVVWQAEKGRTATARTLELSQGLSQFYQHLIEIMQSLSYKTSQMQAVAELLDSLSQETHLLSLNAAIEAAGLGQEGERFGVIAQEVKTLASNSGKSSQEAGKLVAEIQEIMGVALQEAAHGQEQLQSMVQTARHAGGVIEILGDFSTESAQQAYSITRVAQQAQELASLIKLTTSQQDTASQQVLGALTELTVIASQSSEGSGLVFETSAKLEELTQELHVALVA